MNNDQKVNVPFVAHESDMVRFERANKRLWVLCIIMLLLLILTNCAWLYYESQFEYCTETVQEITQATKDGNNCVIKCNMHHGTDRVKSCRK